MTQQASVPPLVVAQSIYHHSTLVWPKHSQYNPFLSQGHPDTVDRYSATCGATMEAVVKADGGRGG